MMRTFLKSMLIGSFTIALIWACSDQTDEISDDIVVELINAPQSDVGILPYIIDGENEEGYRTCDEAAIAFGVENGFELSTGRLNYVDGNFDRTWPGLSITVTDGKYVEWSGSTKPGYCLTNVAVIVKCAGEANVYFYPDGSLISDMGLASPINYQDPMSLPYDLSSLTFCWNEKPCVE